MMRALIKIGCGMCMVCSVHAEHFFLITQTGLSDTLQANFFAHIHAHKEGTNWLTPIAVRDEKILQSAMQEALKPYGYFQSEIKCQQDVHRTFDAWMCRIRPGMRTQWSQVLVRITGPGSTTRFFKKYVHDLPIKKGMWFDSSQYESNKDALQNVANSCGYFQGHFKKNEVIIDPERGSAHMNWIFETGSRYRFGPTQFSSVPLKPSFLMSYLNYHVKTPYHAQRLEKSRNHLLNSNYFKEVWMDPLVQNISHLEVPIQAHLMMQDQVQYNFGAGYGDVTGFRALSTIDIHPVNAMGHRLQFLLRLAQFNSALQFNYIIPGSDPVHQTHILSAGYNILKQSTAHGTSMHFDWNDEYVLNYWKWTYGISYISEHYFLEHFPTPEAIMQNHARLLYPHINARVMHHTGDAVKPSSGYSLMYSGAFGIKNFGSQNNFFQLRVDAKTLKTWDNFKVQSRLSIGYTCVHDVFTLPLSMQFYAGGFSSIRGFSFNEIGPGRLLIVGGFEVHRKIHNNFYLGVFTDTGVVRGIKNQFTLKAPWNWSAGPSVVYDSPVGSVEVSFAYILKADSSVHFGDLNKKIGHWGIQFGIGAPL